MRRFFVGLLLAGSGAPAAAAVHHPVAAVHARAAATGGLLPATEAFDRQRLNYESNPARFLHNHPSLGRAIAQDIQLRISTELPGHAVNGLLPTTPYLNYVRWRHSLDPARFDHYHPGWGPAIERDAAIRATLANQAPASAETSSSTPLPSAAQIATGPIVSPSPIGDAVSGPGTTPKGDTPSIPPVTTPSGPVNPPSAVPEPGGLVLLGLGLTCGVGVALRRRLRAATA